MEKLREGEEVEEKGREIKGDREGLYGGKGREVKGGRKGKGREIKGGSELLREGREVKERKGEGETG